MLRFIKFGILLILVFLSCNKPKPKVEILDYSITVITHPLPYYSGERPYSHAPYCSGRVTNTGDKTAYKVKVHVVFSNATKTFEKYISEVNLEPAEVSSFSVKGDSVITYNSNPPYFSVNSIWVTHE